MRALLILIPVIGLTGCLPLNTYYREGASLSLVERETLACEVKALKDAPVANRIERLSPRFVPGRRVCNSAGKCTVTGGYYVPGDVITVDVNANLRARVERQCMADKGFIPESIPACPDSVVRAAPARATQSFPKLTETSCVIRYNDGQVQIVNRG